MITPMIISPFEVVLPHKDIGHPSPSRRWPGQPDHNGDGGDDGDNGCDGGDEGSFQKRFSGFFR